MESPIVSSTKLLAMIYIAYHNYFTIRPSKSELDERKRREKDKDQYKERSSAFIVDIFPFFMRHLCNSCIMLNFIGLAISQLNPQLFLSNQQVNVDTDVPPSTPALYAPSFFNWNGLYDVIGVLLCVIGFEFREWSMRVLGRFFTLKLGISEGHYLVDTGPYRLLRHPSYTGILLAAFHMVYLTVVPTFNEVVGPLLIRLLEIAVQNFNPESYLAQSMLELVAILNDPFVFNLIGPAITISTYAVYIYLLLGMRVPQEEEMLKKNFGKEWDKFAANRARIIPYIY